MKLIRDRLNNANAQQCGVAAMTVIDRLQSFPPEERIVGLAASFLLFCEAHGISPQDAFTVTKNIINDTDKKLIPEFKAVRDYMVNETGEGAE